jgi:hypothetical protein
MKEAPSNRSNALAVTCQDARGDRGAAVRELKLSATAVLTVDDFSERLERAIARSGTKMIEAQPLPQPD